MPGESKNGMQCAEFEALLSEAVEQMLSGSRLESFQAHAQACAVCGPLLAEAEEGHRWLKSLEEVDPPANLVHNILIATTGRESTRARKEGISWKEAAAGWLRPIFAPVFAVARQPRFAMSFGMAFFSLSITLSMAGVKFGDLRQPSRHSGRGVLPHLRESVVHQLHPPGAGSDLLRKLPGSAAGPPTPERISAWSNRIR